MRIKANLLYKPVNFQMDDCQIEKVIELTREEFGKLKIMPLADQPFIAENRSCMFSDGGIMHCLLVLSQNSRDGVLIKAKGYDYPRYAAYISGMRDILNAEMDRAADFIIRQGVENTETGGRSISFRELEEALGLTVRAGSGLGSMLRTALKRRPEVSAVDMHDGCIEMEYHPEYCMEPEQAMVSVPVRFCNFSPNGECKKMADKGVQPLNDYTCRFRPSSLKCTDKSGLDGLQADK